MAGFCASLKIKNIFVNGEIPNVSLKISKTISLPCHVILGWNKKITGVRTGISTRKLGNRISLNSKMLLNLIGLMLLNSKKFKKGRITITSNL